MEIKLHCADIEKTSLWLSGINKSYYSHYNKESKLHVSYVNYPRLYNASVAEQRTKLARTCPAGYSQWIRPILSVYMFQGILSWI